MGLRLILLFEHYCEQTFTLLLTSLITFKHLHSVYTCEFYFQALQYLRKVCNHPALVLNANHPKYSEVMSMMKSQGSSLRDLAHAPKLTALKYVVRDGSIWFNV